MQVRDKRRSCKHNAEKTTANSDNNEIFFFFVIKRNLNKMLPKLPLEKARNRNQNGVIKHTKNYKHWCNVPEL